MNDIVFNFLHSLGGYSPYMPLAIVFFASVWPYIVILVALLLMIHSFHVKKKGISPELYFKKGMLELFLLGFTTTFAWILAVGLKFLFASPRPFLNGITPLFYHGGFNSFPSGHATIFAAIAFFAFLMHRKQGYFFLWSAVLIGAARIAAGVHYPIDIVAGYCLGILAAWMVSKFLRPVCLKMVTYFENENI